MIPPAENGIAAAIGITRQPHETDHGVRNTLRQAPMGLSSLERVAVSHSQGHHEGENRVYTRALRSMRCGNSSCIMGAWTDSVATRARSPLHTRTRTSSGLRPLGAEKALG